MAKHEIYTIGYGNDPPQVFLDRLVEAEIELVIDVRRKGSRARLGCYAPSESLDKGMPVLLATRDIDYRWAMELGNPFLVTEERPTEECLRLYSTYLRVGLKTTKEMSNAFFCALWECERHRIAFLCAEKSVVKNGIANCHRAIVAETVVQSMGPKGEWSVVHL